MQASGHELCHTHGFQLFVSVSLCLVALCLDTAPSGWRAGLVRMSASDFDTYCASSLLLFHRGFKCRGGDTDIHSHGWGLAIYEGRGIQTFHDPLPCAESPLAEMVSLYPIKTLNMMAHIRYATQVCFLYQDIHCRCNCSLLILQSCP